MLRHNRTNDIRRSAVTVQAALVGAAVGAVLAAVVVHRWRRRQLAAARADSAVWRRNALHDPLTGLPNRRAAITEVNHQLAGSRRFLLALVDLDDFKAVNDTYGHLTGDVLLTVVASRLNAAVAPDGFVARLGGDEFLVLLPDHGDDPGRAVAAMLQVLTRPVRIGAATLRPHASVGVTTATGAATSWSDLIVRADHALYRAKTSDTAVAVHHPHLDDPGGGDDTRPRHPRRVRMQNRLRDRPRRQPGSDTAEPGT